MFLKRSGLSRCHSPVLLLNWWMLPVSSSFLCIKKLSRSLACVGCEEGFGDGRGRRG